MSNNVLKEVTSTVLPFVILGGGAILLVKSGILGKLWSELTGTIGKKTDEIYSSVYNNRTVETIRDYTNFQNIVEMVQGPKTYVPAVIADPAGKVIDWTQPANVVTTEGKTFIPAQIPGAPSDYMMTILGPAKSVAELKAGNAGFTVLEPAHFERRSEDKAWWQKNAFDVAGDVWGFLTGNQKTEHVSAPNLHTQSTGISVITPSQYYGGSSMAQIEQTISKNPAVDPTVAERVSRDEERNLQARSDNARRLAEAEANPPTLEEILNDPSVWPTPSQSTKPNYGY